MAAAEPAWTIHTEVFDGPLDLLLYLVKRDGIDISRVRIAEICDAYLGYLDRLKELRLNVAADYLVMAATLCHLKSLVLLPRAPSPLTDDGEPEEDPTEALARQLEAYQHTKARAEALNQRAVLGRDTFRREPEELDSSERPVVAGVDAFALLDLYWDLLARQAAGPPTHTLPLDGADLGRCCQAVLDYLDQCEGPGVLDQVLRRLETAGERVVAFVATLEMVRLGWLGVDQTHHLAPVTIWFEHRDRVDLPMLTGTMLQQPESDEE